MIHLYPFCSYAFYIFFYTFQFFVNIPNPNLTAFGKIKNFLRTIHTYARIPNKNRRPRLSVWALMLVLIATLIFSSTEFTRWPQRVMPNIELQRVSEKGRKRNGRPYWYAYDVITYVLSPRMHLAAAFKLG